MSTVSGWLFDAQSNNLRVVRFPYTVEEICRLLECVGAEFQRFETPEGEYRIWSNESPFEQALYNESAQAILGRIPFPWKTFHGNFLVTYMVHPGQPQSMPIITVTQFVDACTLAFEKKNCAP